LNDTFQGSAGENLYERLVEALAAFGQDGVSGEAALI
jgi:hypothetical protein